MTSPRMMLRVLAGLGVALGLNVSAVAGAHAATSTASPAPAGTVLVTTLDTNSLSEISAAGQLLGVVSGGGLNGPLGVAVTPSGTTAYVTNSLSNTVSPIDLATTPWRVESPITVGGAPSAIAISPDGRTAYVSNFNDNTVSPVDLATGRAGTPYHVGAGPWSIATSLDGSKVVVSDSESHDVSVIDTRTGEVSTVAVGGRPEAIALTPRSDVAYVVSGRDLVPLDLAATPVRVGTPLVIPDRPVGVAITPSGETAITVNADNTVTRVDLAAATPQVSAPVAVGSLSQADGVAIDPSGEVAYIANASNTVTPVSLARGTVATQTPISVGSATFGVAVVPDQAPVARLVAHVAAVGRTSSFDASFSSAPNDQIATYQWSFGDGTTLTTTSPLVTHRYTRAGQFLVSLRETTRDGTSSATSFTGQEVAQRGSTSASETVHVTSTASLALTPASAGPGTAITLSDVELASSCRPLQVYFDQRLIAQTSPAGTTLHDLRVVVPGDATPGTHVLSISCGAVTNAFVHQRLDVSTLASHLSEFSVAVPTGSTLKKHLATAGLLGVLLILLGRILSAGFPGEFINRTYINNFERITHRLRQSFPRLFIDRTRPRGVVRRLLGGTAMLVGFAVAASFIDSFLNPTAGLNRTTALLFIGQAIGVAVVTLASQGPIALQGLADGKRAHLHVLVGGLVMAALCVAASRTLDLVPGYCYGLIAIYAVRPTPEGRVQGRYQFFAQLVVLVVATSAFLLTGPVFHAATSAHPSWTWLVADPALNMIFLGGFSAVAFGMLPLPFLPGHAVAQWNRWAWGGVSLVGLGGYLAVLLSPGSGTSREVHAGALVPLAATFVVFAVISLSFWGYHLRQRRQLGVPLYGEGSEEYEDYESSST